MWAWEPWRSEGGNKDWIGGAPNYNELWENLNQPTGEVQSKYFSLEFSGIWQECLNSNIIRHCHQSVYGSGWERRFLKLGIVVDPKDVASDCCLLTIFVITAFSLKGDWVITPWMPTFVSCKIFNYSIVESWSLEFHQFMSIMLLMSWRIHITVIVSIYSL